MERDNRHYNDTEKYSLASKALVQIGGLISTISFVAIAEDIALQQGALTSASLLMLGVGITTVLEGIRLKK